MIVLRIEITFILKLSGIDSNKMLKMKGLLQMSKGCETAARKHHHLPNNRLADTISKLTSRRR